MKRLLLALLLVVVALAPAPAQTVRYHETLTVTNGAAVAFATCWADVATNSIYISIDLAAVRWLDDGTAPTTAVGHLALPGTSMVLNGHTNLVNFKTIATTATSAVVTGSCSRP
jgi:hypothetical protein